ncbi:sterol esterase [Laetiporus sulphureus 93-53]|uniref:Carboxylic ester hydrolase n=1 Tax=Laetiporus sulphureus 93-53 TaxID=1314785 RepID=A0A165FMR9_9APHY|nr:sterol esterase [Laetiporus sulphureus 93-53]KZT09205.1 sterol esterase [Laetiporus sulphureus 93-53]
MTLRKLLALSVLAAWTVVGHPLDSRAADPIAALSYASFQGSTSGDVSSFLGMPYATPPIGSLRFAAPQPPVTMDGIQDATSFGAACPQQGLVLPELLPSNFSIISSGSLISEDCLFVNIWKPASAAAGDNLPVLFWIFGGAFEIGDASLYDGALYVERSIALGEPIILVSHNYRVNAFGFLASEELAAENATNIGLRDQRLAMEWVNQYISEFGGDPDKVTIWGESAGAYSVAAHLIWNDGDTGGLFRAAVMESGFPISLANVSQGQQYYDQLVQNTGCSGASDTLSCLRETDYTALLAAVAESPSFFSYQSLNLAWEPRIDGDIIVRNGYRYIEMGLYAKVPVIAGDCYDEGTLFSFSNANITTDEEFLEYIHTNYITIASDSQIEAVGEAYPADLSAGSPYDTGIFYALTPQFKRIASFQGDYYWQAPRRFFLSYASQTQDTWAYLYERGKYIPYLGAAHGTDLLEFWSDVDYIAVDALINFATNVNPNAPSDLPSGVSLLSDITWDQWGSDTSAPPLLTFVDPAPLVEITTDTYRASAMNLLNELESLFP